MCYLEIRPNLNRGRPALGRGLGTPESIRVLRVPDNRGRGGLGLGAVHVHKDKDPGASEVLWAARVHPAVLQSLVALNAGYQIFWPLHRDAPAASWKSSVSALYPRGENRTLLQFLTQLMTRSWEASPPPFHPLYRSQWLGKRVENGVLCVWSRLPLKLPISKH